MARSCLSLLGLTLTAAALAQSAPNPAQPPVPTLHATAKLVIVDVVVRDAQHRPIHGLKQGDFTLLEDGKAQAIKSFEEFRADMPVKPQPVLKLPPNMFTNVMPAPGVGPLNILLLDKLDTALNDQGKLRTALLKYIDTAKPGTRMALFSLDEGLHLLQGFTDDRDLLRAAMTKDSARKPYHSDAMSHAGGGGVTPRADWCPPPLPNALAPDICEEILWQRSRVRSNITAQVMRALALYASGLPGRKNLLWYSGNFPLYFLLQPGGDPATYPPSDGALMNEFREAADMLAASEVAVYPIDVRGLVVNQYNEIGDPMGQVVDFDRRTNRQEMGAMTGGRAFIDENNLDEITAEAIEDGSNYYTIAYTPADTKWNGNYRLIRLQVNRPGVEMSYRQGFYADDPNASAKVVSKPADKNAHVGADAAAMGNAMKSATEYGSPDATQIVFTARVLPASATEEPALATGNRANVGVKGPYRRYAIDFSVDPHAIAGEESADGLHHATVEFVTFVYAADARLMNTVGTTVKADIPRAALAEGSKERVPAHEEISVPAKGDYFLHIAVHDLTNDHVGSIELPISAVRELPAAGK